MIFQLYMANIMLTWHFFIASRRRLHFVLLLSYIVWIMICIILDHCTLYYKLSIHAGKNCKCLKRLRKMAWAWKSAWNYLYVCVYVWYLFVWCVFVYVFYYYFCMLFIVGKTKFMFGFCYINYNNKIII